MRVPMHEFKASLSRHLARARGGEEIVVTSHDKPVARIVGIVANAETGVAALLASGQASWRGGRPALAPPVRLLRSGKPLSEIVLEDRG